MHQCDLRGHGDADDGQTRGWVRLRKVNGIDAALLVVESPVDTRRVIILIVAKGDGALIGQVVKAAFAKEVQLKVLGFWVPPLLHALHPYWHDICEHVMVRAGNPQPI
eukprot:9609148-Lingulodinium_polyedra.AAC.1